MRILLCGGGTAGHVMPNLAIAEKMRDCRLFYVGGVGMERDIVAPYVKSGVIEKFFALNAPKLKRKFAWSNFALPFALAKSVAQSKKILKEVMPDVVLSKGGYVGLPVVIACRALDVPCVIHESDVTAGLANRISAKFATEFVSAFPIKNARRVGAIVRESAIGGDRRKGLAVMGFDGKKPILVVTGGSLGAQALNEAIAECPSVREKFDTFVICGKGKRIPNDEIKQAEFVQNVGDLFAAADLCLTRGGSNALTELTLAGVPFIAVPLKKASRGEQMKNAEYFEKLGCGIALDESNLPAELPMKLDYLFANAKQIREKQKQAKSLLWGTDKVVEILRKYDRKTC